MTIYFGWAHYYLYESAVLNLLSLTGAYGALSVVVPLIKVNNNVTSISVTRTLRDYKFGHSPQKMSWS